MKTLDRLADLLKGESAETIRACAHSIREIRIRAERPVQLIGTEKAFCTEVISREKFRNILLSLMDFSYYSREEELKKGFFTLKDGSRVGVCGRVAVKNDSVLSMVNIGSVCIRISREIAGCSDEILNKIVSVKGVESVLIISPPGLGKTTCLRDIARSLSEIGYCVGISDERHEIAACESGIPTMNIGNGCDVMDGGPKCETILQMIRTMAPDVIITDEIGDVRDGFALAEAKRCGISVIASAHASGFDDLERRTSIKGIICDGIFSKVVLLHGKPGNIAEIRQYSGTEKDGVVWKHA